MRSFLTALAAVVVSSLAFGLIGCASSQPSLPPGHQLPLTFQENSSIRDEQVRENPRAFAIGKSRHQVIATMGEPNRSNFGEGEDDEVYAFHSDGSKFVSSQIGQVVTAAMTANPFARPRRAADGAAKMTIYHVYYASDGTVEAVRKVSVNDPTAMRDHAEMDSQFTE